MTSVEAERTFSSLKRIKTFLRNTREINTLYLELKLRLQKAPNTERGRR